MKFILASEVIKYLNGYIDKFGDLPVFISDHTLEERALSPLESCSVINIYNNEGNQDIIVMCNFTLVNDKDEDIV